MVVARGQLLPNCKPREIMPYELQGYGTLQVDPQFPFLIGNYSILCVQRVVEDALRVW